MHRSLVFSVVVVAGCLGGPDAYEEVQGGNWLYGWTVYAQQYEWDPAPTYHVVPLE